MYFGLLLDSRSLGSSIDGTLNIFAKRIFFKKDENYPTPWIKKVVIVKFQTYAGVFVLNVSCAPLNSFQTNPPLVE